MHRNTIRRVAAISHRDKIRTFERKASFLNWPYAEKAIKDVITPCVDAFNAVEGNYRCIIFDNNSPRNPDPHFRSIRIRVVRNKKIPNVCFGIENEPAAESIWDVERPAQLEVSLQGDGQVFITVRAHSSNSVEPHDSLYIVELLASSEKLRCYAYSRTFERLFSDFMLLHEHSAFGASNSKSTAQAGMRRPREATETPCRNARF
jgi:hypothetical protein